jgi:amidophosphoribosyltransferase
MSKMGDFIAFKAAISLIKERKMESLLDDLLNTCKQLEASNNLHTTARLT